MFKVNITLEMIIIAVGRLQSGRAAVQGNEDPQMRFFFNFGDSLKSGAHEENKRREALPSVI